MVFEELTDVMAINLGFEDKDDLVDHTIIMGEFSGNAVFLSFRETKFLVWTLKEPSVARVFRKRPNDVAHAKELIAQEQDLHQAS